uniref:Uncharacterized protein n=1 Tax=Marseillevirus LCMAC103 TaxID=2506604 RepID=A0A481YU53_9VIRU|nr:MAG: hypothetical protein LCMAC103_00210 [Marseillevirus LCMAC103]
MVGFFSVSTTRRIKSGEERRGLRYLWKHERAPGRQFGRRTAKPGLYSETVPSTFANIRPRFLFRELFLMGGWIRI